MTVMAISQEFNTRRMKDLFSHLAGLSYTCVSFSLTPSKPKLNTKQSFPLLLFPSKPPLSPLPHVFPSKHPLLPFPPLFLPSHCHLDDMLLGLRLYGYLVIELAT